MNLEEEFVLPNTVWGYLEWFTGIIRINLDYEQFKQNGLTTFEQKGFEETLIHEFFHCCQISTTGYLYYYVSHFLKGVAPIWSGIMDKGVDMGSSMAEILENVFENDHKFSSELLAYLGKIDNQDVKTGVSPRDIIEGQAYFIQKSITGEINTHASFLTVINRFNIKEYTYAYQLASDIIGEKTFSVFNKISFVSLLFLEPHIVFPVLCKKVSMSEKSEQKEFRDWIKELSNEFYLLGDANEVCKRFLFNQEHNPFYSPLVHSLNDLAKALKTDLFGLMSSPEKWYLEHYQKLQVPMFFNPGEVVEFKPRKDLKFYERNYDKKLHWILGVICIIIQKRNQHQAPHFLHLKEI